MALPKTCNECQVFFKEPTDYINGECRLNPPKGGGWNRKGSYPVWSGQTPGCSCGLKEVKRRAAKKKGT